MGRAALLPGPAPASGPREGRAGGSAGPEPRLQPNPVQSESGQCPPLTHPCPASCHSSIPFEALDLFTSGIPKWEIKAKYRDEAEMKKQISNVSKEMKTEETIDTE